MKNEREHIAVLVDSYYPNMTMNGVVAKRICDVMEKEYDISIITYKSYKQGGIAQDKNVHPIFFWSVYYENLFASKISNSKNKFVEMFWQLCLKVKKITSYACRNVNVLGINKSAMRKIERALRVLHKERPVQKVLSIAAPFEFQMANYRFAKKHTDVKCIAYQIDFWITQEDIGYPSFLKQRRKNARLQVLKDISKTCKFYMLPFIKEAEGRIVDYNHITACQLPLLVKNDILTEQTKGREVCEIVFTGSLSKEDRNPEKIIDIVEKVNEVIPCKIHFYHRGNCASYLRDVSRQKPHIVEDHGLVTSDEAYRAMARAGVLLSIGVVKGDQIAGKTFDYISTGKRILYVHWTENDVNAKFLEKYPLVLCLNVADWSEEECVEKLVDFLKDRDNKTMTFEEVAKIFGEALPENTYRCLLS